MREAFTLGIGFLEIPSLYENRFILSFNRNSDPKSLRSLFKYLFKMRTAFSGFLSCLYDFGETVHNLLSNRGVSEVNYFQI